MAVTTITITLDAETVSQLEAAAMIAATHSGTPSTLVEVVRTAIAAHLLRTKPVTPGDRPRPSEVARLDAARAAAGAAWATSVDPDRDAAVETTLGLAPGTCAEIRAAFDGVAVGS